MVFLETSFWKAVCEIISGFLPPFKEQFQGLEMYPSC